jgi:hypothetical protein
VRYFLTSHFELVNDIDLSYETGDPNGMFWNEGSGWDPIGAVHNEFFGSLDGNDYEIIGLFIRNPSPPSPNFHSYVGLFQAVENGIIRNVHLRNVDIGGISVIGTLVGYTFGTTKIENCSSSGKIKGNSPYGGNFAGGLVGWVHGEIKSSYSTVKINGFDRAGGLVGSLVENGIYQGKIYDSYATGKITSNHENPYLGGLLGATTFGDANLKWEVKRSYSIGFVGSDYINSSGFIGWTNSAFIISEDNYFNTKTSNQLSGNNNAVSGISGLTTPQMLDSTNFTGFDFENIWDIIQGYSFPYLRNVGNHLASVHQITGSEGWRLISAPLDSISYGALLDSLWTQGFTNADYESGTPNVYTRNEASGTWEAISDSADIAPAGEGILVYVYADDDFDGASDGFPKTLIVQGSQRTTSLTKTLDLTLTGSGTSYDAANDGWNFVGNPYAYPISWDELSGWTKTGLEGSIYTWNNTANEYQSWNGSSGTLPNDGIIPPFQGFWVKANNTGTPSITVTPDARTTGGALLKKVPVPSLNVTIFDGVENSSLSSNSTIVFLDRASVGQDDWDAWKLQPLSGDFLSSFTTTNEGASLDINSLPRDLSETIEIPLDYKLKTNSTIDELSISWKLEHFPTDWSFTLLDQETGSLIDMNSNSSYQFGNVINRKEKSKQDDFIPIHRVLVNNDGRQKGIESSRFIITISPGSALSNGEESELPNQYFLSQNYPNPFNPSTVINFQLPENTRVSLRVFDMLGREVAMLVNGQVEAGYHSVNFDAGNLASGVYIYRLEAVNNVYTKKMTLIK